MSRFDPPKHHTHSHLPKEKYFMSESPINPEPVFDGGFPSAEDVTARAKAVLDNPTPHVNKAKALYNENKELVVAVGVGLILLRLHKRGVSKAAVKAVEKAIANGVRVDLPQYMKDLDAFEKARWAAWEAGRP